MKKKPSLLLDFFDKLSAAVKTAALSLSKKQYFRLPRNRQMLGNLITARLCAAVMRLQEAT